MLNKDISADNEGPQNRGHLKIRWILQSFHLAVFSTTQCNISGLSTATSRPRTMILSILSCSFLIEISFSEERICTPPPPPSPPPPPPQGGGIQTLLHRSRYISAAQKSPPGGGGAWYLSSQFSRAQSKKDKSASKLLRTRGFLFQRWHTQLSLSEAASLLRRSRMAKSELSATVESAWVKSARVSQESAPLRNLLESKPPKSYSEAGRRQIGQGLSKYGQKCYYHSRYVDMIAIIDPCLPSTVLHFHRKFGSFSEFGQIVRRVYRSLL